MSGGQAENRRLVAYVMLAVAMWGVLLALGALLFGYDQTTGQITFAPNVWRGLVVLGCVAAFVGLWALLLAARRTA